MSELSEVSRVTCRERLSTWCWLTSWFPDSKLHFFPSVCFSALGEHFSVAALQALLCVWWGGLVGMIHCRVVSSVDGGKEQQTQICFWSALFDSTQDETKSIYSTAKPPQQACASLFALLLTWEIFFCLKQLRLCCKGGNLQGTAKLWIALVVEKDLKQIMSEWFLNPKV